MPGAALGTRETHWNEKVFLFSSLMGEVLGSMDRKERDSSSYKQTYNTQTRLQKKLTKWNVAHGAMVWPIMFTA